MNSTSVTQICILLFSGLLTISTTVSSEHIVFLLTCASYSHRNSEWPLVEKLLERGHKVTFISPQGPKTIHPNPNITEIVPKRLEKFMTEILNENFDVNKRTYGLVPKLFMVIDLFCYKACEEALKSDEIKNWIKTTEKVDLIISDIFPDCAYGLSEILNSKHFVFVPIPFITRYFEAYGIPQDGSSIPDYDLAFKPPLSFFKRVVAALLPFLYKITEQVYFSWYKNLFKEEIGLKELPGLYEMQEKTSLIMINGGYLGDYARSLPPFVVKVPGIHIKEKMDLKPVQKDVGNFINSKDDKGNPSEGFIYLSFGTVANAPNLPMFIRNMFFDSMKAFPNIRFIWIWNGEVPSDCPKNVYLMQWTDQQALLGHPKIKGFITQAGRPSIQEALYNGIPTITFPVYADQDFNAGRAEDLGTSINLDFVDVTEEKLQNAISRLLKDSSLKTKAEQLASLAKDVPMHPIDVAIWWTEFVLRHTPEELSLLKPPGRNLYWFQKRELDVWGFMVVWIVASMLMTYYIGSVCIRTWFGIRSKPSRINKKSKSS